MFWNKFLLRLPPLYQLIHKLHLLCLYHLLLFFLFQKVNKTTNAAWRQKNPIYTSASNRCRRYGVDAGIDTRAYIYGVRLL